MEFACKICYRTYRYYDDIRACRRAHAKSLPPPEKKVVPLVRISPMPGRVSMESTYYLKSEWNDERD